MSLQTAFRTLPRSVRPMSKAAFRSNVLKASLRTSAKPLKSVGPLSLALRQPLQTALVRYQSGTAYQQKTFIKGRDTKAEQGWAEETLGPLPVEVSEASTIHPAISGEVGMPAQEEEIDMMGGIKSDFVGFSVSTANPS